jgi:general stress protein 26
MPSGYGVPLDGSGGERLPWSWAAERLEVERNYWVCTSRPGAPAHAAPVWGLWLDGAFWFSTDAESRKGRNITADPRVVVHLESGDDVVILEGTAVRIHGTAALDPFVEAYDAKYGIRVDIADASFAVYRVAPRVARTWTEKDFPGTATRWEF